jgi:small subunit ribosomal protein S4
VRPESRKREYFSVMGDVLASKQAPDWMTVTSTDLSGRIITLPTRDQMEIPQFNEALIVEYYSR